MMNVNEAYKKVFEEQFGGDKRYVLSACVDIGDRWVFIFVPDNGKLMTATLSCAVDKKDGTIKNFHLPDMENFALLDKGVEIPIEKIAA
jgi:hypothetical protein